MSHSIYNWLSNLMQLKDVSNNTVSSFQIAWSCVISMTAVKPANNKASIVRNSKSKTVAGGLNVVQSRHSCLTHVINWWIHKKRDCSDIAAI